MEHLMQIKSGSWAMGLSRREQRRPLGIGLVIECFTHKNLM